jgi:hypothetical protein
VRPVSVSYSPAVGAGKKGQDFADGAFVPGGFWQRQVRLDLVAVAAAFLLLDHVAGLGQVGDDAVGAALGDAQADRDVAQAHPRVVCDAQQHPGVVGQEGPVGHH